MSPSLLFPLLAGIIYATAALLIKRAADLGVGVWRTAFVANVVGALLFQPLWILGGRFHAALWWQPVVVGFLFTLGQWLAFLAIDRGDVSVATPVLGLKILSVAVLVTWLAGEVLRWQLWVAAVLATLGIALLNRAGGHSTHHHHVGRTIVMAGLAAVVFAAFDVLIQKWTPGWGVGVFVPLVMGTSGVLSFIFVPLFRAPLWTIPGVTWRWLIGGAFAMGTQSMLFVFTVAQWGQAASANVLYSSRGLWTVVLVWLFGHWVRSREQHLGPRVLIGRLAGAVLMMSAIVLALL